VVPALIPDYLAELEEAEAAYAELNAQYKAATAKPSEDDEDADDDAEEQLSEADLKNLKMRTAAARKKVGALEGHFLPRLRMAIAGLDNNSRRNLVIDVLQSQLSSRLESRTTAARRLAESAFRTWADKYAVTLRDIEAQREAATTRLESYLKELGYA
jgi:type I restriction enzyme M protein